jgi:hypothetical protein
MEAYPRETHYRNAWSIGKSGGNNSVRPTLEELHANVPAEKIKAGFFISNSCQLV